MECVLESAWLSCASMCHDMAWLIFLDVGFVPDFATGPQSYVGATVLALSPAQVWFAPVLPRRDGIVHAGSGARAVDLKYLSSLAVAATVV